MASSPIFHVLRVTVTVISVLAGFIVLFLMYYQSFPSPKCHPSPANSGPLAKQENVHSMSVVTEQPDSPATTEKTKKPVVLLWFWPENKTFDFQDCRKLFKIDSCHLTDDRSLYSRAQAVLVFHKAIQDDLSNLPTEPRTRLQSWIWFNMDSRNNTRKIAGIEGLFNLTLTYRKDADIPVRWKVTLKGNTDEDFVLPEKKRLLCWIVDSNDLQTQPGERYDYYRELVKHIKVDVFNRSSADFFNRLNYFQTISNCKFYLSFEDSTERDYITETFNDPLAVGTVPVALGPPRSDYDVSAPGSSFIHVKDFSDAAALAEFLLKLDNDNEAYMRYFDWRKFFTPRGPLTEEKHKYAHPICQACRHARLSKVFRAIPDLYKWAFP